MELILAQVARTAESTRPMRWMAESERPLDVQENEVGMDGERTVMDPPPSAPPVTIEPATVSPRRTWELRFVWNPPHTIHALIPRPASPDHLGPLRRNGGEGRL